MGKGHYEEEEDGYGHHGRSSQEHDGLHPFPAESEAALELLAVKALPGLTGEWDAQQRERIGGGKVPHRFSNHHTRMHTQPTGHGFITSLPTSTPAPTGLLRANQR